MIHKVKSPFLCFEGQFFEGERNLCCGISVDVLRREGEHKIQVGNTIYKADKKKCLEFAQLHNSIKNIHGKSVAILPTSVFEEIDHVAPKDSRDKGMNKYKPIEPKEVNDVGTPKQERLL